jgi:hypothetical protein
VIRRERYKVNIINNRITLVPFKAVCVLDDSEYMVPYNVTHGKIYEVVDSKNDRNHVLIVNDNGDLEWVRSGFFMALTDYRCGVIGEILYNGIQK